MTVGRVISREAAIRILAPSGCPASRLAELADALEIASDRVISVYQNTAKGSRGRALENPSPEAMRALFDELSGIALDLGLSVTVTGRKGGKSGPQSKAHVVGKPLKVGRLDKERIGKGLNEVESGPFADFVRAYCRELANSIQATDSQQRRGLIAKLRRIERGGSAVVWGLRHIRETTKKIERKIIRQDEALAKRSNSK